MFSGFLLCLKKLIPRLRERCGRRDSNPGNGLGRYDSSDEITILLGQTRKDTEFIKIRRYKRKTGYKIVFVQKYWSGKYRTLLTKTAVDAEDVIRKINDALLPIFRLRDEDVEKIRRFCSEGEVEAPDS